METAQYWNKECTVNIITSLAIDVAYVVWVENARGTLLQLYEL